MNFKCARLSCSEAAVTGKDYCAKHGPKRKKKAKKEKK
jgi:hypothetical protein